MLNTFYARFSDDTLHCNKTNQCHNVGNRVYDRSITRAYYKNWIAITLARLFECKYRQRKSCSF